MALLKFRLAAIRLFGRFPKTEEVEARYAALRKEYQEFLAFEGTDDYMRYVELKGIIDSGKIESARQELQKLTYKGTPEQLKEDEFKRLGASKPIKNFFTLQNSESLAFLSSVELSGKPLRYSELKEIVESDSYKAQRSQHKKEQSDDYKRELEFNKLKKDGDIKRYIKLKSSTAVKDYFTMNGSETLARFEALRTEIDSPEFQDRKKYLMHKNKFELSEESKLLEEYNQLAKSEKIVWYFKVKGSDRFKEIERWELTFSDEFDGKQLNTSQWLPRYFWGDALMGGSYSLAADLHFYPETKNISVNNSTLTITTQKEQCEGLAWNLKHGFIPSTFQYSSGIVNTGQTFRQKHGRFEAKIKFSSTQGVFHAFWLVGEKMLPELDVMRKKGKDSSSVQGAYFWQNELGKAGKTETTIGGFDFSSGFYILSIDWNSKEIVWKINGIPFKKQANNLPDTPMYVVLSSGVNQKPNDAELPVKFEIDWVRCWREVKPA